MFEKTLLVLIFLTQLLSFYALYFHKKKENITIQPTSNPILLDARPSRVIKGDENDQIIRKS